MMPARRREHGQILVLFVLALLAMLAMAALLTDGAYAYVERRKLQDAGDAAALAGANLLLTFNPVGCSASFGPPPGAPRQAVVDAAKTSIAANLPGFNPADVAVTCPASYSNAAVRVQLREPSTTFLGGVIGASPFTIATTSVAKNGQSPGNTWSVVLLDPWEPAWPNGRRGCPSMLISGGPTINFDGAVQIDSNCPAANGGALGTNGNSATVNLNNGVVMDIVGDYVPGPLTITPPPLTHQPPVPDPLCQKSPCWLANPDLNTLNTVCSKQLVLGANAPGTCVPGNNNVLILPPGIYDGGIQLKNSSIALLEPGIYVFNGGGSNGGLNVGSQATFCSIGVVDANQKFPWAPTGSQPTNCSNWTTQCTDTGCGVLLYNYGTTQSGSTAMGQLYINAGATVNLRAYDERAIPSTYPQSALSTNYRNLMIFQARTPAASGSYAQPVVYLNGGGSVNITGTVYAPQALVHLGGGSGGSGGTLLDLTIQFIAWDLEIQGNSHFHFLYSSADFVTPIGYGLAQ